MGLYSYLLAWTKLPIRRGDLVLEVGSGGRPFARSDVLCDMFIEDSVERQEGGFRRSILADRPFVCANGEMLPFRDDTFDFLLSAHTLEHLIYPEHFLNEAMRVSQRGYFVTPSEFCERILPRSTHLWMISTDGAGGLVLKQKRKANESEVPGLLHEAWATDRRFKRFFDSRPDLFETRFKWEGCFVYQVLRHEERPPWFLKGQVEPDSPTRGSSYAANQSHWQRLRVLSERGTRAVLSRAIRTVHSPRTAVDVYSLLVCPVCQAELEPRSERMLRCVECHRVYPIRADGIPVLLADAPT